MEKVDSNFITSVHGRDNFANQIKHAIDNDKILFANKTKSQELLSVCGPQLTTSVSNLNFDGIIHQSRNIVNAQLERKRL